MRTLQCLLVAIFISFFCLVQSAHALCGNPITIMSDIGQTSSTVYGYSKTQINPCAAFYYDLPKVESTMTEQNGATVTTVSQGQHQSYAASYPAQFNHNYGSPVPGRIYQITGVHFVSAFYQGYESGSGWFDPYQVGNFESGNGGWMEYEDPYFGYVTYWYNIPIYIDTTYASLVYQSSSPPPIDPITGCAAGYTSLGGVITSEPTAGVINNKVVAFVRGTDNAIYYKYSTGGNFSSFIFLGGGTYQSPKSAVINGTLYLEVVGTDNNPYYKMSNDGISFSNWIQGTVGAETIPFIDFNGFNYNFAEGQQVAQPALCFEQSPILSPEILSAEYIPLPTTGEMNNNPGPKGESQGTGSAIGKRIFPDKKNPSDLENRAKLRVKATVSPAQANVRIYFRTYDMDDPSDNILPIDDENENEDNRGEVNLSKAGRLNCPTGLTVKCLVPFNKIGYVETNSSGVVEIELEVTKQPGDNFAVAVSKFSSAVNSAKPIGNDLVNNGNVIKISGQLPATTALEPAIRTELLTVWRTLHMEVDSMGNVSGNKVDGSFPSNKVITANSTTIVPISPNDPLDFNRFDGGRMVIKNSDGTIARSFSIANATFTDFANTSNNIAINNTSSAYNVTAGQEFTIYDDDDIEPVDGLNLDGDEGDDVTAPNTGLLVSNSDNPVTNVLAAAYIRTVRVQTQGIDAVDTTDNSVFKLNLETNLTASKRPLFADYDRVKGNVNGTPIDPRGTDDNFWTVCILGSYQPFKPFDLDPPINNSGGYVKGVLGSVDEITGVTGDFEGTGALIFMELHRYKEFPSFSVTPTNPNSVAATVAHEVGHLFSSEHGDGEIMGIDEDGIPVSTKFSNITLNKIRKLPHP